MARDRRTRTARNATFFINLVDNTNNSSGLTAAGYVVFGQVVQGMDVVDKIAAVETHSVTLLNADDALRRRAGETGEDHQGDAVTRGPRGQAMTPCMIGSQNHSWETHHARIAHRTPASDPAHRLQPGAGTTLAAVRRQRLYPLIRW